MGLSPFNEIYLRCAVEAQKFFEIKCSQKTFVNYSVTVYGIIHGREICPAFTRFSPVIEKVPGAYLSAEEGELVWDAR